jgi:hypothetical protein
MLQKTPRKIHWLQTFYMMYAIPMIIVSISPQTKKFYKQ